MTSVRSACLNPIRPLIEEQVGDIDVQVKESGEKDLEDIEGVELACGACNVEDAETDVRRPKPASRPYTPTREEVYEHEVTHLPFRSWCRHCVFGKGVSSPHQRPDKKEKIGITVSMDYCFMNEEEKEDDIPSVLIIWDDNHECLWALPVEHKGPVEWVVKWIVDKMDAIGYRGTPITLKTDQEPAITALKAAVAAKRIGVTTPIESPVRESQANGAAERAVRTWQGQLRTMKNHFEESISHKLAIDHPLMVWLVLWAGEVILKYVVRPSGRTVYEQISGHRCKHPVVIFGKVMNFKLEQDESRRGRQTQIGQRVFLSELILEPHRR